MPRASKPAQAKPEPAQADPLADLREPDDATRYPDTQDGAQEGQNQAQERLMPVLADQEGEAFPEAVQEAFLAFLADMAPAVPVQALTAQEAVDRWHANTVALGFLHKGGRCGCLYVAQTALGA